MIRAELLVTNIGRLATLERGPVPRTGAALGNLSIVRDAALAVRGGTFVYVGSSRRATRTVRLARGGHQLDAQGGTVLPGLVDAHSHAAFAG
ncbi:MAG: imidazolonepropionase, partial [Thermoplasmata archaeon]